MEDGTISPDTSAGFSTKMMTWPPTPPAEYRFLQLLYDPTPIARFGALLDGRRPVTIGADVFDLALLAVIRDAKPNDRFRVDFGDSEGKGACAMRVISIEPAP